MNTSLNRHTAQLVYDVIQEFLEANPEPHIKHNFNVTNKFLLQRIEFDRNVLAFKARDIKIMDKLHIMNNQKNINQLNVNNEKIL